MHDDPRPRSVDELQHSLKLVLGSLERDLGLMLGGLDDHDADEFLDRLEARTQQLDESLQDLRSALSLLASAVPTNFNLLGERALQDVLTVLEVPLVILTSWGSGLPDLHEELAEPVVATLRRVLSLAIRRAGPGGELRVETSERAGRVRIEVAACSNGAPTDDSEPEPLQMRSQSVAEFVRFLGGSFELRDGADGTLHLDVEFDARAGARR